MANFSRPRPGGGSYPMSNAVLLEAIRGNAQQGQSFSSLMGLLRQEGYTRSSVAQQLQGIGYSPVQIHKIETSSGSTLNKILTSVGGSFVPVPGIGGIGAAGAADAGATAAGGGAAAAGSGAAAIGGRNALAAGAGLAGAGLALNDTTDFLNFIAWIFHPVNWLRAVEFLTGGIIIYLGLRVSFRTIRGSAPAPPLGLRRLMSATPIGRSLRVREGRRSGRRQEQVQQGVREGRQRERERYSG